MKWQRDWGLTWRMLFTGFLLLILYLIFLTLLYALFPGLGMSGIFVIVALMAFVQYYFSDKIVLWSTRARIVEEDEYPELHTMVERLAVEADLPKPRIAVMPSPVPNAFATGRNQRAAVVAVTDSIMRLLTKEELEAVLAHELSHVKNRDVLTMTIAGFLSMLAFIVMRWAFLSSMFGRQRESGAMIVAGIVAVLVWIASTLLIRLLSRYREFAADRGSAYITNNPQALISALYKISGRMDNIAPEKKQEVEGANAFFIIPALSGRSILELFSTHPPLEKRVAALEEIEREQRGY
jgi:heat shock protein HtpX